MDVETIRPEDKKELKKLIEWHEKMLDQGNRLISLSEMLIVPTVELSRCQSSGGSKIGSITAPFMRLVEMLGYPHWVHMEIGAKTTVEWCFTLNNMKFYIYDYCSCIHYDKHYGVTIFENTRWSIGGMEMGVVNDIRAILSDAEDVIVEDEMGRNY